MSYSKSAVDKEIAKDKRIKGREAKMIHAVLKGRQKTDEPARRVFVVVEGAGTDDEKVVYRDSSFLAATEWAVKHYGRVIDDIAKAGVDVMREFSDGTRTTEL